MPNAGPLTPKPNKQRPHLFSKPDIHLSTICNQLGQPWKEERGGGGMGAKAFYYLIGTCRVSAGTW